MGKSCSCTQFQLRSLKIWMKRLGWTVVCRRVRFGVVVDAISGILAEFREEDENRYGQWGHVWCCSALKLRDFRVLQGVGRLVSAGEGEVGAVVFLELLLRVFWGLFAVWELL
ncbi:hypothetical protein AABB24_026835, partial [Solanum stoloniferum]